MTESNIFLIILFAVFIIIIILLYFYFSTGLIYTQYFRYECSEIDIFKYNALLPKVNDKKLPKVLYQTYFDKSKIPKKVFINVKKYASDYEHIIMDDNEIIKFLSLYFNDSVIETFLYLKGPHKADLFRYCVLYVYGGIYADIKTEFIKPINEIFTQDLFYSCLMPTNFLVNFFHKGIYQGVIASPPRNPIFIKAIQSMVFTMERKIFHFYLFFCYDLFQIIKNDLEEQNLEIKKGLNGNKYYLFEENISYDKNKCYDGLDRHGYCCYIKDKENIIIKTRYSDYPW